MFRKHLNPRASLQVVLPALFAQQTRTAPGDGARTAEASPRRSGWTSPRYLADEPAAAFCDRRSSLRWPRRSQSARYAAPIRISMSGA